MSFDAPVTVRHVRFANEQTGWAVLDAAAADGTPIALVGPLHHLDEGERAHIVGEWVTDSRYGRQVRVSQARPLAPDDPQTLAVYLRRVRHVGPRRAQALIDRHGAEAVFDAIDSDPETAFAQVGLRGDRAAQAARSWRDLRVTRRLHLLLAPHGLAYLAGRVHEHHGPAAHELIVADPYELTSAFGVGFAIADRIARGSPQALAPGRRERAAVMHVLSQSERDGSSCAPLGQVLADAGTLVGGSGVQESVLTGLIGDGQAVREGEWIYRTATAELEAELAVRVHGLVSAAPNERLASGSDRAEPDTEGLTEEQQGALQTALRRPDRPGGRSHE
jgi:exodeoxyribonuclease V alpha subunit